MYIIKTKLFAKWAIKNGLSDALLIHASEEIAKGHYEVNYGSGLIKKRVASHGHGKSGSARTIVAFKKDHHCFFVYGFEKNVKSNISKNEESAMKIVAKSLFSYTDDELLHKIKHGALMEIIHEKK